MVNASMNDRIKPLPRSAVSALLQQSRIRGRWKLAAAFTLVEITIVLTLVGFLLLGMTRIEAYDEYSHAYVAYKQSRHTWHQSDLDWS